MQLFLEKIKLNIFKKHPFVVVFTNEYVWTIEFASCLRL